MQWWIPAVADTRTIYMAVLQWGHHFAVVDTRTSDCPCPRPPCSFNGATTLQWWIRVVSCHQNETTQCKLQWGHHFAVVDTTIGFGVPYAAVQHASMGPPLCSGGYSPPHGPSHSGRLSLQWGHHFAVVDTSVSTSAIARAVRRFNGATTLQWWIPSPHFSMPGERMTLQWGHHFAVVDTAHGASVCAPPDQASMGPPLCSGGYPPQSGSSTEISTRFNGATTLQWWIH